MSGAEIYLKFKAWMEDKASAGLQALSSTAQKAAGAVGRVAGAVGGLLGDACGPAVAKASAAVSGFLDAVTRLGPLGGVLAGAQILVQGAVAHLKEEVEAFKKSVDVMAAKVRRRFEEMDKARTDRLNASLKEATTLADRAAKAFDAMAAACLKAANARNATAKAGEDAGLAALELEKSNAMGAAGGNRALVGAGYDVRIAERRLANARSEAARAVETAAQEERDAGERDRLAKRRLRAARKALSDALEEQGKFAGADARDADVRRLQAGSAAAVERAEAALGAARDNAARTEGDLVAAGERLKQARLGQAAALARGMKGVNEAKAARDGLVAARREQERAEAEKAALEEERRRADARRRLDEERRAAEKALVEARRAQVADLRARRGEEARQASLLQSRLSEAQADLANAWHLYRDKSAMKAVMDEEAAQREAEKAWARDFDRLRRRRDWRTAENLGVDERATREVALAKERKAEAEKALVQIERNTANLDAKLDELLQIKDGGRA